MSIAAIDKQTSAMHVALLSCVPGTAGFIEIVYQSFRGKTCLLVRNRLTNDVYRLNPIMAPLFDNTVANKTLQEIYSTQEIDAVLSQDKFVKTVFDLFCRDLLQLSAPKEVLALLQKNKNQLQHNKKTAGFNFLSIKLPVFDPADALVKTGSLQKLLFKQSTLVLLSVLFVVAAILAAMNYQALTSNIFDRVFSAHNVLLMILAYIILKFVHESCHALAIHFFGGRCHEMGIMFLLFFPVPYVDAADVRFFSNKWQRIIVSACGILSELFIASLALFGWLLVEPGIVHSFLWNVMLIGSLSAFFFNGNPLLRFDGYYVLSDYLEIPNLYQRSRQYLSNTLLYGLTGINKNQVPYFKERFYLISYGLTSISYRLFILFAIAWFFAQQFFLPGILLGLFVLFSMLFFPLLKLTYYWFKQAKATDRLSRLGASLTTIVISMILLVGVIPFPRTLLLEGVLVLPDEAYVRAPTNGFIETVTVNDNDIIEKNAVVMSLVDEELQRELSIAEAQYEIAKKEMDSARTKNPALAQITEKNVRFSRENLESIEAQQRQMDIRADMKGHFFLKDSNSPIGRYFQRGDILGHIVNSSNFMASLIVEQDQVDALSLENAEISIYINGVRKKIDRFYVEKMTPSAISTLPSKVLGTAGGGDIVVDPGDEEGLKTLKPVFKISLNINENLPIQSLGNRVFAKFSYGSAPLIERWQQSLARLFLRHQLLDI